MRGRQTRTYQKPTEKISVQQVMSGAEMEQNLRQKESSRMENDSCTGTCDIAPLNASQSESGQPYYTAGG